MEEYRIAVFLGIGTGLLARLLMLRTDYRQYPTNPHGKVIHITLGFIAAALGAIAVPALFAKDFAAITFLALAAQQFREVRNMERQTLSRMDEQELVPRGGTYIEGIAMVFEGRNYLVILTALCVTFFAHRFHWLYGLTAAAISLMLVMKWRSGKSVAQIARIRPASLRFEEALLLVDDIPIMNVGLSTNRQTILNKGLGIVIEPAGPDEAVTLANLGQRQAILHDCSTILGVYRDAGTPSFVPLAKLDLENGRVGVFLLPQDRDIEKALLAVGRVPVLESAIRMPSESAATRERRMRR